jgi:hypothetical protein
MTNLTLTIHFCDISQSFVSTTKYENTSSYALDLTIVLVKSVIVMYKYNFDSKV